MPEIPPNRVVLELKRANIDLAFMTLHLGLNCMKVFLTVTYEKLEGFE